MTVNEFISKYIRNEVCYSTPAPNTPEEGTHYMCGQNDFHMSPGRFWRSQETILEGPVVSRLASARGRMYGSPFQVLLFFGGF